MAAPLNCDECGEQPGAFLVSNQETAETKAFCGGCFAQFGLAFAIAVLPPEVILTAVGPVHVAEFAKAEGGEPAKRGRKRPPEPAPEPAAEPEAAEGLAEDATAASDL